jgi:hypothetical protein
MANDLDVVDRGAVVVIKDDSTVVPTDEVVADVPATAVAAPARTTKKDNISNFIFQTSLNAPKKLLSF